MDPVVHFELPYDDRDRMSKFYKSAFGWKTQKFGEEMGNYVVATTAESDVKGLKQRGIINGGFYQKQPGDGPEQHASIVISVNNIRKSIQKINAVGGKVLGDPMPIPGVGEYVSFVDTEGNRISILQPIPVTASKPKPKSKSLKKKKK